MFICGARRLRHQVSRSRSEHDLVCRGSTRRLRFGRRMIGAEFHAARRQERDTGDDVLLRGTAMPSDGCARPIFVDEGHGKRFRINAGPQGNLGAARA